MTDPADTGVQLFFARLKEDQHRELFTYGKLLFRTDELSNAQRKLLEPVIDRLNRQSREGGLGEVYTLIPFAPTLIGISVVLVPDVPKPVVSWWLRSPLAPTPSWVTLLNGDAVTAPLYYRAHLEQLRVN
jgi:hypothetical protein